jgi:hypothetical protein
VRISAKSASKCESIRTLDGRAGAVRQTVLSSKEEFN